MEKVKFERNLKKENEIFEKFCKLYQEDFRKEIKLISERDIVCAMLNKISANDARECGYDIPDEKHIDGSMQSDFSLYVDSDDNLYFGRNENKEEIENVIPKFPKVDKILKKSLEYIKYCRQLAQEFLDATDDVPCDNIEIDYLSLGIDVAETKLSENACLFYERWGLRPMVLSYMEENGISYEHALETIYRILAVVEYYLFSVYLRKYEDVDSVEILAQKMGLPKLTAETAEDLFKLRQYTDKNVIYNINCKLNPVKTMRKRAKNKTYESFVHLDTETIKIYMALPEALQEYIDSIVYCFDERPFWTIRGYLRGVMNAILDFLYTGEIEAWKEMENPFVKRFCEEVKKSKFDELYSSGGALAEGSEGRQILYECALKAL